MSEASYDNHFLRKVIRGEIWFKRCPDCETTGQNFQEHHECETCGGLGYNPVPGFTN
jgi:rRNA maturation endonuclease Nob1